MQLIFFTHYLADAARFVEVLWLNESVIAPPVLVVEPRLGLERRQPSVNGHESRGKAGWRRSGLC